MIKPSYQCAHATPRPRRFEKSFIYKDMPFYNLTFNSLDF